MAKAWVCEWKSAAVLNNVPIQAPHGPPHTVQQVEFNTSTACTNAIRADTHLVGLYADTAACWQAGANPEAVVATSCPLGAGAMFFIVPNGPNTGKFAFITQA
jgi:hypothetical protein